jgi:SAM-dependent methyltransferase
MLSQPKSNLNESRYQYADAILREYAQMRGTGVVFDIGAGKCPMKAPAEAAGLEWHGFDLFPETEIVHRWDLSEPCPISNKKADIILMMDVIEHLLNPGLALQNVVGALQPGGCLLLTMPNPHWSRSRIHHLMRGNLANFTQHDLDWNHHVFTPWRHVLEKILHDNGFEVLEYSTLDGQAARIKPFANPLSIFEGVIRKIIERSDKSARGMSYALLSRLGNPQGRPGFRYSIESDSEKRRR